MSIRYLDFSGAVNFWTNIKNYILSKIPTKTSELTNDSGFLTQHQSLSNYVTLNSEQTITGKKLFTNSTTKVNSVNTFIGSTLFIDTSASVPRGSFPAETHRVGRVYIGDNTSYNGSWFIIDPIIDTNKAYYRMVTTNPDNTDSTRFSITWDSTETGARCRKNVSTGDLLPYANNTYNLGSNNQKWDIGYIHNLIGTNKENASEDANNYYSTTSGSHMTFYTTSNGGTKLSNVPAAVNTHLESRTIRYLSSSDWIIEQICHNSFGLYYRKGTNGTWEDWKTFAFTNSNITGTAANVTGTVDIANGGTGATTRLNAVKALTNEAVASPTHFLAITTNYAKAGYTTIAQAKTVLGITGDIVSHNASEFLTSHQSLDNYVTLNSNQTITAIKTITGGNQGKMIFKNPNYTKGDALESNVTISRLYFGNNASYDSSNAVLTTDVTATGISTVELCAINNTASNSNRASLILSYDKSATSPRLLKSWGNFVPYSSDNYTLGNSSSIWKECYSNAYYLGTTAFGDIVTHNASEFLTSHQSLSSCVKNVVTNNQTIKSTGITRGTAPSSAQTFGIGFSDNNNKYISNIYGQYATDKSTYVGLYAYKGTTTSNGDNASVRVGYDASGNAYTYAPTPATADNSTQIATTAFVKAQGYLTSHQSLANYVTTNTDQSISGIKSHSKHISILGDYIGNESSTNGRSCLYLKANRDTDGKSGLYVTKFRQNVAQGSMGNSDVVFLSHDILENETRTNAGFVESYSNWENDVPKGMSISSTIATRNLGTSAKPWTNAYITNLILNGNAFDPTSIDGIGTTKLLACEADRFNSAGDAKPGSSLYDVSMMLDNSTGYYGVFDSRRGGEFSVVINSRSNQPGTWKVLHDTLVGAPQDGARSFAIAVWVRIA